MKDSFYKNLFRNVSIVALSSAFVISCMQDKANASYENSGQTEASKQSMATITIYIPDGTTKVFEVLEASYGNNNTRTFYTTMDGKEHSTTLPVIVDLK